MTVMRRAATVLVISVLAVLVLAAGCSVEQRDITFDEKDLATAQSSRVYDRNGVLIAELRGEQRRTDVTRLDLIPEVVRDAVVAIEDERFYEHDGVDLKAILRAARSNVAAGGISQGGSTITQQYVGNVFLDRSEQTVTRKIEEFFMARRFEQANTKDRILLLYLNWVYFGNGAYGIEAAARQYFGAPACELARTAAERGRGVCLKVSELTLEQAALLAGLIQRPSAFDPYRNPQDARRRRNLVLERMLANQFITADEYERAYDEPILLIEDIPVLEERYPRPTSSRTSSSGSSTTQPSGRPATTAPSSCSRGASTSTPPSTWGCRPRRRPRSRPSCPTTGSIPTRPRRSWAWVAPRTAMSWPWSGAATSSAMTPTPSSTWPAARAARPVRP